MMDGATDICVKILVLGAVLQLDMAVRKLKHEQLKGVVWEHDGMPDRRRFVINQPSLP
jgi:hypothetical protein